MPGLASPPSAFSLQPSAFRIVPLERIRSVKNQRQPGYVEVCLSAGTLDSTGCYVTFTTEAFCRIRREFSLKSPPRKIIKPCC